MYNVNKYAYMSPTPFEIFPAPCSVSDVAPPLQCVVAALIAAIVVLSLIQVSYCLKCCEHCPNFV